MHELKSRYVIKASRQKLFLGVSARSQSGDGLTCGAQYISGKGHLIVFASYLWISDVYYT